MIIITKSLGVIVHVLGQVCFKTDNWIDTSCLTYLIKLDGAIHCSMVCNSKVIHPKSFCLLDKFLNMAKTI